MTIETGFERTTVAPQEHEPTVLSDLIPTQAKPENGCDQVAALLLPPEGSLDHYAVTHGLSTQSAAAFSGWTKSLIDREFPRTA